MRVEKARVTMFKGKFRVTSASGEEGKGEIFGVGQRE